MVPQDISFVNDSLNEQRSALADSIYDLESALGSMHGAETGVLAPLGRTSLRDILESSIGEVKANITVSEEDVRTLIARLQTVQLSAEELDVRLGAGWEEVSR